MRQRGAVGLLQRRDQHVVSSPTRLNFVEDFPDPAMNLLVDGVGLLGAERSDDSYVDRLPEVAWPGIEPVAEPFQYAFAHVRGHSGRLTFLCRRIGAKEVPVAKLLHVRLKIYFGDGNTKAPRVQGFLVWA
jgi:hypothetical protein